MRKINEEQNKGKPHRINLYLTYKNPQLVKQVKRVILTEEGKRKYKDAAKTIPCCNRVPDDDNPGYIDTMAKSMGINRGAFVSFCIFYFCEMPNYTIRQFIFPYFQYFCELYSDTGKNKASFLGTQNPVLYDTATDLEPREGSTSPFYTKKIQLLTVSLHEDLYNRFDAKRRGLLCTKKDEVNTKIPFSSLKQTDLEKTTSQFIAAILTYMYEYKIIKPCNDVFLNKNRITDCKKYLGKDFYNLNSRLNSYTIEPYSFKSESGKDPFSQEVWKLIHIAPKETIFNNFKSFKKYKDQLLRPCQLPSSEAEEKAKDANSIEPHK
jgi:hypothetical protein